MEGRRGGEEEGSAGKVRWEDGGRRGGRWGRSGSTLVLFAPEEMNEDPKAHI